MPPAPWAPSLGLQGFPGTVHLSVTYTLTGASELFTEMEASTGRALRGM